jgi:capsular polysaccharide biosynthesis protein
MPIVVAGLAAAIAGLLFVRTQPAQYETSARFIIAPSPEILDDRDVVNTLDALANRRATVATFGEVVLSERTFEEAVKAVGFTPVQAEQTRVSVVVLPEANVVEVFVRGPRPELAEEMLEFLGSESTAYFRSLYKVYLVESLGVVSTEQVAPKPLQTVPVAGVLGATLAFGVVLTRDRLDARPSASAEVRRRATPEHPPPEPPPVPADASIRAVDDLTTAPGRVPDSTEELSAERNGLGRGDRGRPHEFWASGRGPDGDFRWRAELDELGRMLEGWTEGGDVRTEVERPDPETPT